MAEVSLPSPLVSHTPALGSDVLANDQAITDQVNGNLDTTNVTTAAPSSQTGAANAEGSASTLMRSDAQVAIQGFEQLASDPGSPNAFQIWMNTSTPQLKGSVDGVTVKGIWPLGASDLPNHSSNHATGGSDPLPGGSVDQSMLAQKTLVSTNLGGDVTVAGADAWNDVITGVAITCSVAQTLQVTAHAQIWNTSTTATPDPGVAIGVFEVISGVDTFVAGTGYAGIAFLQQVLGATWPTFGARVNLQINLPVNVAAGTHTYKLKAAKSDGGGSIFAKQNMGVGGTTVPLTNLTIRVA